MRDLEGPTSIRPFENTWYVVVVIFATAGVLVAQPGHELSGPGPGHGEGAQPLRHVVQIHAQPLPPRNLQVWIYRSRYVDRYVDILLVTSRSRLRSCSSLPPPVTMRKLSSSRQVTVSSAYTCSSTGQEVRGIQVVRWSPCRPGSACGTARCAPASAPRPPWPRPAAARSRGQSGRTCRNWRQGWIRIRR